MDPVRGAKQRDVEVSPLREVKHVENEKEQNKKPGKLSKFLVTSKNDSEKEMSPIMQTPSEVDQGADVNPYQD